MSYSKHLFLLVQVKHVHVEDAGDLASDEQLELISLHTLRGHVQVQNGVVSVRVNHILFLQLAKILILYQRVRHDVRLRGDHNILVLGVEHDASSETKVIIQLNVHERLLIINIVVEFVEVSRVENVENFVRLKIHGEIFTAV